MTKNEKVVEERVGREKSSMEAAAGKVVEERVGREKFLVKIVRTMHTSSTVIAAGPNDHQLIHDRKGFESFGKVATFC